MLSRSVIQAAYSYPAGRLKLPRRGHFFTAKSVKKRRIFVLLIFLAEGLQVAEKARIRRIHNAPEIREAIFDRRAGQCDPEPDIHAFCRISEANAGSFDLLCLVEDSSGKPHLPEVAIVVAQRLVSRQYPVGVTQSGDIETRLSIRVFAAQRSEALSEGCEALAEAGRDQVVLMLLLPVREQPRRCHNQDRVASQGARLHAVP